MAFKIADAFVDVDYHTDGAEAKLRKSLADLHATAKVDLDTSGARVQLTTLQQQLSAVDGRVLRVRTVLDTDTGPARSQVERALAGARAVVRVDADTAPAEGKVSSVEKKLAALAARKTKVDLDVEDAERKLAGLRDSAERRIAEINARELKIKADIGQAELRLTDLKRKAEAATGDQRVKVDADIASAEARLAQLRSNLAGIGDAKAKVDADISGAQAKLSALNAQAQALEAQRVQVTADADTGSANAQLAVTDAAVARLDGRRANVNVDADVASALAKIASVAAALSSLGAIAAAGIGAAVGVGAVAAGGIGAFAASLSGVGGAVKALGESNRAAGAAAGGSASNHLQMAAAIDRVKMAQAALANTQANTTEQIRRADQSVITSKEALARAVRDAAQAAEDAAERVADAEQRLSDAVQTAAADAESASRRVVDAEQTLADAQQAAQMAQEDLTNARRDAARAAEDLAERVEDLGRSERGAALSVEEAKLRLDKVNANGRSTDLQRKRAQLDYEEAIDRLDDVRKQRADAEKEQEDAQQKGIDGSAEVVQAQQRIIDTQKAVERAERDLADAREEQARRAVQASRDVAAAQDAVADAREAAAEREQRSAEAVLDAQRRVKDAEIAAAEARRQAAYSVAQAQQSVIDAQRAVQQASQAAGGGGAAAMNKLDDKMKDLTPTAREFVYFLRDFIDGPLLRLRQVGQNNLLPGLQRGMEDLVPIMDDRVTPAFARFSGTLGRGLEAGIPIAGRLTASLLDLANESLSGLAPLEGVLNGFANDLDAVIRRMIATGDAQEAMEQLSGILDALVDTIPPLIEVSTELLAELGPGLTAVVRELGTQLVEILRLFVAIAPVMSGTLEAIAPITPALVLLGGSLAVLSRLSRGMAPLMNTLGSGFRVLGRDADGAAAGAGRLQRGLAGLTIGLTVGTALDKLARSGDAAQASINETEASLLKLQKSGAADAIDQIFARTSNYGEDNVRGFTDALDRLANPGLNARLNSIAETISGGLIKSGQETLTQQFSQVGQALATMVQSGNGAQAAQIFAELRSRAEAVGLSVDDLNKVMPEYQDALLGVANQSKDTTSETERMNSSLRRASDEFLQGRAAENSYRDAVDRAAQSVQSNGRTLDAHTAKGRDNRAALDALVRGANDYRESLVAQGAPAAQVQAALEETRRRVTAAATAFGLTGTKLDEYVKKALTVPATVSTSVKLNGVTEAENKLQRLLDRAAYVNGRLLSIQIDANAANVREDRGISARARGGPVAKGVPYIVGEERPELFVPDVSGQIIPDLNLLHRPVAAGQATQPATSSTGRQITIGNLNLNVTEKVELGSREDRLRIIRQFRDELVKFEDGYR